jgi:flagellar M-ring protein FliF
MMEKLKEWPILIKERWQALSSLKKLIAILSVISVTGVVGSMYYLNTRVEYGVLFTDLSEADAGAVTNDLAEQQIDYRLTDKGATILIAKDQIDEYRIQLAVENKLPNTSTGFELFDDAGMMTTDEDRKIMYQRAVTGELQRAIETLDSVKTAKVLLVMPEDSVFSSEESTPTASIVLTLRNQGISDEAVQGIVTLTAGAVENLDAENVKVVDSSGNTLTVDEDENSQLSSLNSKYIAIKNEYEKILEEKVSKLLEPIYGASKYQVSINLDLNFDSIESTKVTYDDPEIKKETVQAAGSGEAIQEAQTGTVDDNVSNVTGDDGEEGSSYSRSVENELSSETTKRITAPGMIQRMTSSVVVNADLSQNEQAELQLLIASAVGYDADRGDDIAIQGFDFAQADAAEITDSENAEKLAAAKDYLNYIIFGGIALVTILLILFIVGLIRRRRREQFSVDVTQELSATQPADEATTEMEESGEVVFGGLGHNVDTSDSDEEDLTESEPVEDATEELTATHSAKQHADSNPEVAAELIKAWMKEK